jgi:hypothetical protein
MSISKVIGRAWADPAYKARLLRDPAAALTEANVRIPAAATVKVVEDTADTKHFVLPAAPADASTLSEEDLEKVAGGFIIGDCKCV